MKWDRNTTIAKSLYNVVKEETPTEWTLEEISSSNETFCSNKIATIMNSKTKFEPTETKSDKNYDNSFARGLTDKYIPEQNLKQDFYSAEDINSLQKPSCNQSYGKELANLARMYDNEMKYRGEQDSFDFKLAIFLDHCERADIPDHIRPKAYLTMLSGAALNHYYANIASNNHPRDFDVMCRTTQNYFEGAEYKRSRLARWDELNLGLIIKENAGKSTGECLQILIFELRNLQMSLSKELRSDDFFHNKLINSCRKVPACSFACFKPSETLTRLINDLQSSIKTYEESKDTEQTQFFTAGGTTNDLTIKFKTVQIRRHDLRININRRV